MQVRRRFDAHDSAQRSRTRDILDKDRNGQRHPPIENGAAEEVGKDAHQRQKRKDPTVNERQRQIGGAGRDDVPGVLPRQELSEGFPAAFGNRRPSVYKLV